MTVIQQDFSFLVQLILGYQHLWLKTRAAFKYIYENHFNDTEWFFNGDDDTYVIPKIYDFFFRNITLQRNTFLVDLS